MNKELIKLLEDLNLLYVEDEKNLQLATSKMFKKFFKNVDLANNGQEGLEFYKQNKYDIVITDITMPLMNGLEMSKKIREINVDQIIIITSAYSDFEKLMETIKLGLDSYLIKPVEMDQLFAILKKVALNIKNRKENQYYKNNLEEIIKNKVTENISLEIEKIKNYEETITALVNMVEIRDSYTCGHSQRVAQYSRMIAEELKLDDLDIKRIYQAGILHDIGKIAIPDSILLKPTNLTSYEFDLMKKHAVMSYEIIDKIPMYKDLSISVKYHHERYDGSGYPEGLKGDEIPLFSQIMAISDTFDAMTTSRIYKPRKDKDEALLELTELSDKSFSKEIVDVAVKVLKDVEINKNINQNPISDFEEQRFSFFYRDKLTDLFNSDYLDVILNKNSFSCKYPYLTVVLLHNFTEFNKTKSWEKGDKLLSTFGSYLKENFSSNSYIFRFRGDDFIILNKDKYQEIDILYLEDFGITIGVLEINLRKENISSYSKLNDFLNSY